jgi:hypothetical protein
MPLLPRILAQLDDTASTVIFINQESFSLEEGKEFAEKLALALRRENCSLTQVNISMRR